LHRDPRWYREPDRFLPDRWLDGEEALPRYAFLPFGAGPGQCLGESLAWRELAAVVPTISRRWRLRLTTDVAVVPRAGPTLKPQRLMMRAEAR
jgi:cytochrome P450